MTPEDARAYFNYLLTLNLRQEEAFGPLALAFVKEHDISQLGLLPEEQFHAALREAVTEFDVLVRRGAVAGAEQELVLREQAPFLGTPIKIILRES